MTNLNITKENSVLQGNELIFSFGLATDLTVFNKYVTNYRYRYVTEDAYCGSDGCYYLDSETSKQYSDYSIIPSAAIKNDGHAELNFVVPHFTNDKVIWIQIEAFDDERGVYDSTPLEFGPIMTYYNEEPKLSCTSVTWDHENILITWSIIDMGVLKPKNLDLIDYNSNGWKSYVNNLKIATKTREAYIRICAGSSLNKQEQVLVTETIPMDKWHPMSQLSTYSDKQINSSNNWYIKAEMSFSRIDGEIDFDFIADSSKVYSSNVLLLNSLVPAFQIKRRGIKVHMLENDSTLGTFATGAGMFNHNDLVGALVSPMGEDYLYEYLSPEYIITCQRDTTGATGYPINFKKTDSQETINFIPFSPTEKTFFDTTDIETLRFTIILEQYLETGNTQNYTFFGHFKYDKENKYSFIEENGDNRVKAIFVKSDGSSSTIFVELSLNGDSELLTFTRVALFAYPPETIQDVAKGHSIALYDTRAEEDHVSNKPSIGFMNDKHQTMGYLKYGFASDGRPALLSNLPIIGNNQEVEDDPSISYNMSIGLILGNNEVKTISFNGKLS